MNESSFDTPRRDDHHSQADEFAELFWQYVDRLNAGENLDAEKILWEQPELGSDLLGELRTMRSPVTLELLARVVAPPSPPPLNKLHRWMQELGVGDTSPERRTLVSAEEIAALSLYGWLRLGGLQTHVRIRTAKQKTKAALRALKRHRYVALVVRLTKDGTKVDVVTKGALREEKKTRLVPGDERFVFPLSALRDQARPLLEEGELSRLAATSA